MWPNFRTTTLDAGAPRLFRPRRQARNQIREKYEDENHTIRIIGFAKLIGDIADGAQTVVMFFFVAFVLTALAVYLYSRSIMLTAATLFASLTSVVWQFGLLNFLGYGLDPLAVLVPFLVFAIGVSHGVQQINVVTAEISNGADAETAARTAFSRLFIPGSMALITTLVSFATLYLIPVPMIRELAITASIGVILKVATNLVMLPLLVSYLKFDDSFVHRVQRSRAVRLKIMSSLGFVANRKIAPFLLAGATVLFAIAVSQAMNRHVGALHAGAPELRPDARYNVDSTEIANSYALGLNVLIAVVETPPDAMCAISLCGIPQPLLLAHAERARHHARRVAALRDQGFGRRLERRQPEVEGHSAQPAGAGAGLEHGAGRLRAL